MNFRRRPKNKQGHTEQKKMHDFLDMISPSTIKFYTDYYICGNTYRSVWAIRQYPTSTEELALLRYLGEKENVTLKIYSRIVTPVEERKIISSKLTNKNENSIFISNARNNWHGRYTRFKYINCYA